MGLAGIQWNPPCCFGGTVARPRRPRGMTGPPLLLLSHAAGRPPPESLWCVSSPLGGTGRTLSSFRGKALGDEPSSSVVKPGTTFRFLLLTFPDCSRSVPDMSGATDGSRRLVTVETRLPEKVAEQLKEIARKNERSVAAEIRVAVNEHVERAA